MEAAMASFKEWLAEAEIPRDRKRYAQHDLIGDLRHDHELPDVTSEAQLRSYIERCGACAAATKAIAPVWRLYERWLGTKGVAS
jgi:hypothetical protein